MEKQPGCILNYTTEIKDKICETAMQRLNEIEFEIAPK